MRTKACLYIIATLAILSGLLSVAWINSRRAQAWNATKADFEAQRERAEADLRMVEQRIGELRKTGGERGTASDQQTPTTLERPPAKPSVTMPSSRPSIAERLRAEPETQALWLIARRAQLATRFGPLMQQLRLSSEQRARFEAIELRREEQELDLRTVEGTDDISSDEPAMVALRKKVAAEYEESLQELLGDGGRQRKKEYERTTMIREMVNGIVGGTVAVTRTPLNSSQAEQLIRIMANSSESYRKGGQANGNDMNWDLVDAQARAILSDAQFALFRTMEPPLPLGARHQAQLYSLVEAAKKRDAAGAQAASTR